MEIILTLKLIRKGLDVSALRYIFQSLFVCSTMSALMAVTPPLSLTAIVPTDTISPERLLGKAEIQYSGRMQLIRCCLAIPCTKYEPFGCRRSVSLARRPPSAAVICAAAFNARCGAEQTQTVTRQSSTITIAPIQGKEKSPELDDGGTGFPPRDDGDGGGGGGGGGHGWSGGFFFFGLLAFLGFLKDKEGEGPYRDNRRR